MSLLELLEGNFFNQYIKTGKIMMLSEGRAGIDNLYYLKEGLLTLELNKESYERAGLVGKAMRDGGRKHVKTRYSVELDLRLPSMLHGKKGFERIVWAFKNVLTNAITWLFYDYQEEGTTGATVDSQIVPKPIDKHHPTHITCLPTSAGIPGVLVPNLSGFHTRIANSTTDLDEWAIEIHEWLSLIALQSPRVQVDDSIDPYLCRYQVPGHETAITTDVVMTKWTGFLPAEWVRSLFVSCAKEARLHQDMWFVLGGSAFKTKVIDQQDSFTVLRLPRQDTHTGDGGEDIPQTADESTGNAQPDDELKEHFVAWELIDAWQEYS